MAQYTGVDELDGLFKVVYPDTYVSAPPEQGLITKMIPFEKRDREGKSYNVQIVLAYSQGFTYNTTSGTAYALNDAISMTSDEASVAGSEITLRNAVSMKALAKSAGGNKTAFKYAMDQVVEVALESMTKRLELSMIYGGTGVGIGTADSSVNASATTTNVTMLTAGWSVGIWAGMQNAKVQFYNGSSLISSGADSIFTVTSVNPNTRVILFTGTATGITALDAALASGDLTVYFNGAYGEEMLGIVKIMTTSGSLFGIDNSVYDLWKANSVDCGNAQLTMGKVLQGASLCFARSGVGKLTVVCNPKTWQNLSNDLAALRRYDGSYKRVSGDNGFESIKYFGQVGEVEIIGYNLIKEGDAIMINMDEIKRLGASDITFNVPGMGDRIFFPLPSNSGVEIRTYADQCVFINKPAGTCYFSNIVNV